MRTKTIDKKIYIKARGEGLSQVSAYKLAGGRGKTFATIATNACLFEKKLQIKDDLIQLMKEKRNLALRQLTVKKAKEDSFRDLVIAIATLIDKIQLLEGRPTENIAQVTQIYLPDQKQSQFTQ